MSKNIYIVSDLHLGAPDYESSLKREKRFVQWLESIENETDTLYLVGDVFDFWFEYRKTVPQGFLRILGKLAMMADNGIKIHLFSGNHDLWYGEYLQREIGAKIHREAYTVTHFGKKYFIAHGDGLGPGDYGYKFIKKIFTNPVCQWLFRRLHPDTGISLANFFSRLSASFSKTEKEPEFYGENEHLIIFSREVLNKNPDYDYFIFGHRHILKSYPLSDNAICIYLGDWLNYFSFVEISQNNTKILTYTQKMKKNEKNSC